MFIKVNRLRSLALLLSLLMGCGSSDSNNSSSNNADASGNIGQVTVTNVCDLVKQAEAESFLEKSLSESPKPSEKTGFPNYVSCIYTSPNSTGMGIRFVQVMIYQSAGTFNAQTFYENAKQGNEQIKPADYKVVQNLGESAYIANKFLHILIKGKYLSLGVGSLGEFKEDKAIKLAKLVLTRLP